MSEKKMNEDIEAAEFTDELSDETLDEKTTKLCVFSGCRGGPVD